MEIISLQFLIFSLTVLAVYHLLPRRGQNVWMAASSIYFAATWKWEFAAILIVSILINFTISRLIANQQGKSRFWLTIGILLNAGGLIFFRFVGNDLVELLIRTLTGSEPITTGILMPIGFSFYTLQAISYLVDVSRKTIQPENNLINFAVYMAWFPRLLSGPIERAKTFLPQIKNDRIVGNLELAEGGWLILLGLFRKLVIASLLFTLMPEGIFPRPLEFAISDRWLAILVYSFWLYNDFTGYTDIVRGISLLFGIRLTANFRQPFFSRNFQDFWNRWHISLSFWLRDYIFLPIQRNLGRRGFQPFSLVRTFFPPLVTMLVSGMWHNATLAMVAWGGVHGLYLSFDHLTGRNAALEKSGRWLNILHAIKVFLLLLPTWILFACGGLKQAYAFSTALFLEGGMLRNRPLEMVIPIFAVILSLAIDFLQEFHTDEKTLSRFPAIIQSTLIAIAILCILLSIHWSGVPSASFVYQTF